MVDNTELNSGSGGDTIATDDIGGVKHQRVKVQHGADGSATDVSAASPMPVDQQNALPAGTNAIGKLAANSGVDIGDVDVTSVVPGVGATNLGKAEDAAHSSGDVGVMPLAVRNDKLAGLAGSDGDYAPLQVDADGALYTNSKIFAPGTIDTFGHLITGEISNQIEIQFFRDTPANLLTVTTANSGTTSQVGGSGKFETSTNVNGQAKGVTTLSTSYRSGSEIYTIFTALFTTPTDAGSYQRIGLYDDNNGMFFGFEGTSFGVTIRNGGSDTTVAKGSFSEDSLTGAVGSKFTSNGIPEAIDLTKLNVYRIRYGWLGSAPIHFEVLSPDDEWIAVHTVRQPNNAVIASVENPDLPMTIDINKTTSDATNLIMLTNCWGAGTTISAIPLDETLTDGTLSKSVRAILAAKKPNGSYQNIGSTAGGNLKMSVQEISDGLDIGAGNAGSETQRVSISTDDVNLSALKAATSGPDATGPSIDSYTQVAINLTTGANQVLASSAANKQIWVYGYMFTCGDAAGQTVSFQDEDDAALSGIMEFAQYGGASVAPSGNFSMPIWKLGTDKDLEVDITGGDVDGWLTYAIVSV